MEKLKLVLIGVVLLLAAAVVYGYVDDGDSGSTAPAPTETTGTVAEAPPSSSQPEPESKPEADAAERKRSTGKAAARNDEAKEPESSRGGEADQGESGRAAPAKGSQPAAGSAPAKSEYLASVDAICGKLPGRFSALAQEATSGGAEIQEELEAAVRKAIVRALKRTAREIKALTPPAGDAQEVAGIVGAMEKAIRDIQRKPTLDPANETPLAEFAKRSKRYGLVRCGQF